MTKAANLAALGSVVEVPSGSAPSFQCRAWVNFNGTGTVAIRGSGNVSSITDNSTGNYTVNFTTAMPDANYSISGASSTQTGGYMTSVSLPIVGGPSPSTGSVPILVLNAAAGGTYFDSPYVLLNVFR